MRLFRDAGADGHDPSFSRGMRGGLVGHDLAASWAGRRVRIAEQTAGWGRPFRASTPDRQPVTSGRVGESAARSTAAKVFAQGRGNEPADADLPEDR